MLSIIFLIKRFTVINTSIITFPTQNIQDQSSFGERNPTNSSIFQAIDQNANIQYLTQDGIFYMCIPIQMNNTVQNDFVGNTIMDQPNLKVQYQNYNQEYIKIDGNFNYTRPIYKIDTLEGQKHSHYNSGPSHVPNLNISNSQKSNQNFGEDSTETHDPKTIEDYKNLSGSYGLSIDDPLHDLVDLNMHDFEAMLDTSVNIQTIGKKSQNENGRIQKHNETRKRKNSEDQAIFSEELIQIGKIIPNNTKRMKLDDSSIIHKAASIISEEDKSASSPKKDYIYSPDYKYIDTFHLRGEYEMNYQMFEQEKVSVISPFQESHQNSDNSFQNTPTEYQASSEPVNLLVPNPDHTIQSPGTDTNEPEKLDKNTKKVYFSDEKCMILNSKIIDNVEILENVNLSKEINIKEFNLYDRLLCEDVVFSNKIFNLEQKYLNSKKNDLYCFSFEESFIEDTTIKIFVDKYLEVVKDINIKKIHYIRGIISNISFLHEKFNLFFKNEFVGCVFKNPLPEHYWEFLKIFVDIARDPLFSVILPEFSTFNFKRNICYFKFVDNLDFVNVLKFKIILNSYKFLFDRVKLIKNDSLKSRISIFVFNSRFILRRYLICCLSSIWESNIRKLYMRITCHNIDIGFESYENIYIDSKRHESINKDVVYRISSFRIDNKEYLIRLFFQIDIKNFRHSLGLKILVRRRDDFSYNCFFKNYLLKNGTDHVIHNILKTTEHIYGIYKTYSDTLKIYMENSKNSISNVFSNPKFRKELKFSDLQKVQYKQFGNCYPEKNIDDDLKYELLNFKKNINKHQQLFAYFDDQNIGSLADSIIL